MISSPPSCDVVIVGAGMAGLTAARQLEAAGAAVVILDKGRAVGGRMATRRIGDARFDHGAQHFSARSRQFSGVVAEWKAAGRAHVWFRSASITTPEGGIEDRHAGTDGMRGIPEHLARGLDVRTEAVVERVGRSAGKLVAQIRDRDPVVARGAIITTPAPQIPPLLGSLADVPAVGALAAIPYDSCMAVMAQLDAPAAAADGHVALDGDVAWIGDNQHKGVSGVPAVTIHSSPAFAEQHLDADPARWTAALVAAAAPFLGANVTAAAGHRWRYARPRTARDDGCLVLGGGPPIVLAGEVFAGARVEGAFLSGLAAATDLEQRL